MQPRVFALDYASVRRLCECVYMCGRYARVCVKSARAQTIIIFGRVSRGIARFEYART